MRHIRRPLARVSAQGATLVLVATTTLMLILAPAPLAAHATAGARLASSPVHLGPIHAMPIRGKGPEVPLKGRTLQYLGGPVGRTNTNYVVFWEPLTL